MGILPPPCPPAPLPPCQVDYSIFFLKLKRAAEANYTPLQMCDLCIPVLGRRAKAHPGKPCVVAKTLYCSLCCVYGHSYTSCAETDLKAFRVNASIIYEEVPAPVDIPDDSEKVVEVTDDDEGVCVRAMLIANNIVPMACQEKGRREGRDVRENRARLVEFMKARGKILVLVRPRKFVPRRGDVAVV